MPLEYPDGDRGPYAGTRYHDDRLAAPYFVDARPQPFDGDVGCVRGSRGARVAYGKKHSHGWLRSVEHLCRCGPGTQARPPVYRVPDGSCDRESFSSQGCRGVGKVVLGQVVGSADHELDIQRDAVSRPRCHPRPVFVEQRDRSGDVNVEILIGLAEIDECGSGVH